MAKNLGRDYMKDLTERRMALITPQKAEKILVK